MRKHIKTQFNLKIMNIKTELREIQIKIDLLILKTPTGPNRNDLTEINMKVLNLMDKVEEPKITVQP